MRKIYAPSLTGKNFLLLLLAAFSTIFAKAQIDISIGTGTAGNAGTTYPAPLQDWYEGSRAQFLYRASELNAAGMGPGNVNAIKFNVTNLNTFSGEIQQFTVKIGSTATASLSTTTVWEPATVVYGPVDYVPVLGVNTITFTTPFFWNGTDNLVVEICNGLPANTTDGLIHYTNNVTVPWTTGLSFNGSHTVVQDNNGNMCNSASGTGAPTITPTNRPNIIFNWTAALACSGTPTAGTANTSAASVCLGESFTLSLSGGTIASGLSHQWQSSPDGTSNWTNIGGATTPTFTATQTATAYYRAVVTCANGGASATSTVVQVASPLLVNGTFTIDKVLGTNIALRRFGSFNEAYNYIKCGINGAVVFNVATGTGPYTEQLIMAPVPGASSTNTVTFNGNGEALQYLSTNTNERAVIKLNGADFIGFNNLVITATGSGASDYGFGVQFINDADSNRITNCKININTTATSTNFAGIVMNASATSATTTGATLCDGNLIDNNVITGGYYGITLVGSSSDAVRLNAITNNTVQEFYFYGIYLSYNFSTQVEGNRITRPTRTAVTTSVYGIYATNISTLLKIIRNRIYNPYGGATTNTGTFYGIYFTAVDVLSGFGIENLVANNAIYNTNFNGSIYGLYNSSSDGVFYYHNTVAIDGSTTTSGAVARGFYQITAASGIELKNNIFYISRTGTSANHTLYFATTIGTTNPFLSNYNDLVLTATTGTNYVGYYNSANRTTLLDWQTASSQDANSLTVNPIFQAPASENYAPTNASLNDKGTPVNVPVDINGLSRSTTTPDIGAWEFTPGACIAPPTPGAAVASTNPVCTGFPVSLTLNGNSIGLGQTYTLQSSATAGGTYANVGGPRTLADTVIQPATTLYYRFAVTCSGITTYSTPVLVSVNQRMPAGTYTIDKNNPTTYPATGNNFNSFAAANNALQCGIAGAVVFNVTAGRTTYNEQLIIDSIPGASAINTVTFNGNGNTIRFHSNNTDERAVIKLRRADFVTLDSLIIDATGTNTYGWGVQLISNADSNTIRRCTVITSATSTSTNDAGIVVSASENTATTAGTTWCDGNLIERNTVTGGYYGITMVGNTGADVLQNNVIRGNTVRDFYFYGIYLGSHNNLTVEGNDIYRSARTNGSTFYGIYGITYGTNWLISKNRIHNPFDAQLTTTNGFYGIYLSAIDGTAATPNKVINNAIYNVTGDGDEYGLYNTGSDYVQYYHNTLSFDNQLSQHTTTWWTRAIYQTTQAAGLEYKNNIVSITRTGDGDRHAMYMATAATTFASDYNDLYVTGQTGTAFTGYYNANITTLAAWQTAAGQDARSFQIRPRFRNAAAGDLYPLESTIDNKGTNVNVGTDILNVSRNNPPDIGAWEFAIPPCTAPPAAGTASAVPSSGICRGAPISLSLTGINTVVAGQTYQWQYSTSASGPWTNLGGPLSFPDTTIEASRTYYYRAVVTCSGQSANSGSVLVTLNPALLGGYYTINPAGSGSSNFPSFSAAAAALACGIDDDVWFAAVPGTYNEQVRIGKIPGASDTARVTFMSQNGNPASVILTYGAGAANNYTLKLDSSSFVTFRDMTINATDATNGRAIDIAGLSASDSLANLVINVPVTTNTGTTVVGIFGNTTTSGQKNVIRRNTINNGTAGIYYVGSGASRSVKIDSNTVNNPYYYGIYFTNSQFASVSGNTVNRAAPTNATAYSIYAVNLDSAYEVVGNRINSTGLTTTQYGMYLSGLDAATALQGRIANNRITVTGATGTVYGMYQTGNTFNYSLNNVIAVATTGSSYALYSTGGGDLKYYNNSVNNASTGATNFAGYFVHTTGSGADVRNNVFANNGGGIALYNSNPGYVSSDYNLYYTSGSNLFQTVTPAGTYGTLNNYIVASGWDQNSLVYKPAFNSNTDLSPKLTDSTVWAMHGRGVQIAGNSADVNGAARPTTLTTGVPDLGAFEFLPTVAPMPLQGIPALPAPNTTQVFMLGTDTVAKISWKATVPSTIALRRYSGVLPTGTTAAQQSMYFYTKADVTGTTAPTYDLKQFYIDPWQGFIPREAVTRLGRTNASGTWLVDAASRVDTVANVISRDTLNYIDRFTGLTDATIAPPPPPVYVQQVDSSNRGKRFWVAYANSYNFDNGNDQEMVLYFGAGSQPARVTVRIMGTTWVRTYTVPANTAITSAFIPKVGVNDARLVNEGQSPKGILIESDVDISAYAHIYASANSGATMLLPVGVYGYEYYTLNTRQFYTTISSYSSFFVVADRDNTKVEITPSNPTLAGKPKGVPFTVTLNAGETYQVLGAYISGIEGYDLTGSLVKSVPNSAGKCYPIAVFAGSSRTYITCGGAGSASGGDLIFQQVFPSQAWGTRYLTAPTSTDAAAGTFMGNVYRVMVKDTNTVVRRNGTVLTNRVVGNRYYQFESGTADYIEADQPIMVAQYMPSSGGGCANTTGDGDPEMFYLSPVEQAVKETQFYRNTLSAITTNYVTLIVPTAGLSSLLIDGSATFDYTAAHPNRAGYSIVVKRYGAGTGFSTVKCDSAFTGIVYGLGSVESYGYNVGTLVKNLNALPSISNTLTNSGGAASAYTCANTPFRFYILLPLKPTQLTWQFSQVQGLSPNADVVQNNPAVLDSTLINGRWYYRFTVAADYTFSGTGNFNVPILITHPTIEGCSNSFERLLTINVVAAPNTDFSVTFTGCLGDAAQFSGSGVSVVPGVSTTAYNWNFGDNTTGTGQSVNHTYAAAGTYNARLNVITAEGCLGEKTKPVVVNPRPTVTLVSDSVTTCPNVPAALQVQNPVTGTAYNWYTTPTGGTPVFTGATYNVTVAAQTVFYVEAVQAGCSSTGRRRAVVAILPNLTAPVVQVLNAQTTPNSITWGWTAVPNATGYQVSTDNGNTWAAPSTGTGPSALTHTVTGLPPLTSVTLLVRALGGCQEARSQPVTGKTLTDQVYIPNSFSPNGDGLNDVLKVYGYVIKSMQFTVFNQWGEKIFESRSQQTGWDGTYKGQMQPSGVYIYVARFTLNDGSAMDMKGTINLVR